MYIIRDMETSLKDTRPFLWNDIQYVAEETHRQSRVRL